MTDAWIDGGEAIARLGIKPQTLYAYVSRGRLRARPHADDPRRSLYSAEDVARLQTHKARGRKGREAAEAMDWGDPVLPSAITAIVDGRLWFRGADAAHLAERATLEAVALRLWDCPDPEVFAREPRPRVRMKGPALARALAAMAVRAGADSPALGRSPAALWREGAGLMVDLAGALGEGVVEGPVHAILAEGWGLDEVGAD
ncbi:MAG: citrate synthase, partial [Phenylobacterium sp.]